MKNIGLIVSLITMAIMTAALLQLQKYNREELSAAARFNEKFSMVIETRIGMRPADHKTTVSQILPTQPGLAAPQK